MREDVLVAFAVGNLVIRVAGGLSAALKGNAGIVFPKMLLPGHALDGRALLLPDRRDVQKHRRLPVALLGLVWLEQEHGRSTQHLLAGIMPVRLGYDAGVLSEIR